MSVSVCLNVYVKGLCGCVLWKVNTTLCLYFLSARHAARADGQFTQLMTVLHDHGPDTHTRTHKTHRHDQSPSLH